ncbi:MAG: PEP-CTERM sorting domain-containing protein, partial [Sedimentisphaerales bacterium]|nr:PEP-CTERM sorting domain-containing protein [Sedimentisphaerales bacterium]
GNLEFSAMQYIPDGSHGQSFLILLNQYDDGGPYDWSVQLNCDLDAGQIVSDFGGGASLPIIWGEWVELKCVIDLVGNTVDEYYDGTLLSSHQWDDTWNGTFQCIDLFANGASPVYYDDISVVPEPATLSLLCLGGLTLIRKRRNSSY